MSITRTIFVLYIILLMITPIYAQSERTVTTSYTQEYSNTTPPIEAKLDVIQKAQIKAIRNEFGTTVSESNALYISEQSQNSNERFFSIKECDINGEWIETIGDTSWTIKHKDHTVVYTVKLKGKIREITNAKTDFKYKFLYNGTDPMRNELRNFSFQDGDTLYLYFRSPVDGYLALYIVDHDNNMTTQRLLPQYGSNENIVNISADSSYIFFSPKHAKPEMKRSTRRLTMRTHPEHTVDYNQFYLIFSPNRFSKATDYNTEDYEGRTLPPSTDFATFSNWLKRNRRRDKELSVEKILVDITRKKH